MNYQKSSTGFRIGAAVGIIILMLGVAIALSVSANSTINDQMKIMTNFNMPLEKVMIQMNDIQKNQGIILNNSIRFLELNDVNSFQSSENEFYANTDLMTNEIAQAKDIVSIGYDTLPQEYVSPPANMILTKIDDMEKLNKEYTQLANDLFTLSYKPDNVKLTTLVNNLEDKQRTLETKQNDLLGDMNVSYQSIETSVDENKQKFLTLEIIIIISVGVISLISSHFVNQINKDLIREVIKKTKSLQKANEKLRKSNLLKDEFISEASHELKSPLSPIYGFVELAKCGDIDKEEALAGIVKQAHQIEEVANKMLDLGKIDNNRLQISPERFNLDELVSEIADAAKIHLNKDVSIETNLAGNTEVEADKTRIGQVIRNLINNAMKFTQSGRILVTSSSNGINAEVKVTDTGTGIHPDILPKIFNKFVTKSHRRENLDGSGLGLYICKGIIDAHDGEIHGYNNPDRGATIFFSIPVTHNTKDLIKRTILN